MHACILDQMVPAVILLLIYDQWTWGQWKRFQNSSQVSLHRINLAL